MSLFRQEVLDHKRKKLHGDVLLIQPIRFALMTAVFFILALVLVAFLMKGQYQRKETVVGYIAPANGLSVIRADQGGRLTQIFVNEGDFVELGMVLFECRIDVETEGGFIGERSLASVDFRLAELETQNSTISRRYKDDRARLKSKISNLTDELLGLNSRAELQKQTVEIASAELIKVKPLVDRGLMSEIQYDRRKANSINQKLALENIERQKINRTGELNDANLALRGLSAKEQQELSQLRIQISQLRESRARLEASSSYLVRSSIAGTITALQGKPGQSVSPTAPIVMIVPEGSEMVANLLAPSKSTAFLETGQEVNLLVDAFPYQKFGVQKGMIEEISKTPFRPGELDAPISFEEAVYRITVKLDKQTVAAYGNEVELKSGMTLQGDLIVDERSILQWMLDPLLAMKRS